MGVNFPVSISIKAFDKASKPLQAITQKLQGLTNSRLMKTFSRFGHDLGQFGEAAGFAKLGKGFGDFGGAVKRVGGEVFSLGARLLALGGFAAFGLYRIVRGAVDAGDKLAEMAQRTGTSINYFAALGHAAAQADVDQEQFNASMDQFNKRLGEARANGGPLLALLKKVSPALGEQLKGAKSTEAAMSLMTDAFARLKDPAKRAALSAAAFGRSGLQMGEFLHSGSAAIQEQMAAFMRLSGSQEDFAKNAGELDNALRNVETAFLGLRSAALGALFPAFTKLAGIVSEFIVKNRDGIKQWAEGAAQAIQRWVDGGGFERLIANVREFLRAASGFLETIGGWKVALAGIAAVMAGPLIASIAALVPAIYSLGAALLTTPVGWITLGLAAAAFALWKFHAALGEIWNSGVLGHVGDGLLGILQMAAGLANLNVDQIIEGWTRALNGFQNALTSLDNLSASSKWVLGLLNPGAAGHFVSNEIKGLFGGAGDARPVAGGGQSGQTEIVARFENAPPGLRVSQAPNSSQPIDLDIGYSMSEP